jgi:hypothetical protein
MSAENKRNRQINTQASSKTISIYTMKKNWSLKCQLRSKLDPLVVVESPIVLDAYETKQFYTWDKADIGLADFDIKDNELILDFILEKDSVKLLAKQIAFPPGELNFNDIGMDHVYARQNVEMSYMCKKNKKQQWATIEIHLVSVRGFPAYDLVNSHKRGHKITCMLNNSQYLSRPQECLTGQEDRLYQWLPPDDGVGGVFEGLSPRTVTPARLWKMTLPNWLSSKITQTPSRFLVIMKKIAMSLRMLAQSFPS